MKYLDLFFKLLGRFVSSFINATVEKAYKKINEKPDGAKLTLKEFIEQFTPKIVKLVHSTRNFDDLEYIEGYIRTGLENYTSSAYSDEANLLIKMYLQPKRTEFELKYKGNIKEKLNVI